MSVQILSPGVKPQPWDVQRHRVGREWGWAWDYGPPILVPLMDAVLPRDVGSGNLFAQAAGALAFADEQRGRLLLGDGTASYLSASAITRGLVYGGGARTVIFGARTTGSTGGDYFFGYGKKLTGEDFIGRLSNSPSGPFRMEVLNGFKTGTTNLKLRDFVVVGYTLEEGGAVAADGTIYVDGVDDGETDSAERTVNTNVGSGLHLLSDSLGTNIADHDLYFFYLIPGAITAKQHAQVAADPFGLVRPARRRVYRAPAVVGGLSIPVAYHHRQRNFAA